MKEIAVVVIFERWTAYVAECVAAIESLQGGPWPLILVPDEPLPFYRGPGLVIVRPGGIPLKRNAGTAVCPLECAWIAFVDSDARPRPDWLENFRKRLEEWGNDPNLAAVVGPGLTPPEDPLRRRITGQALGSPLIMGRSALFYSGGGSAHRVPAASLCNLIIRRAALEECGGFNPRHPVSEDVQLCDQLNRRGRNILYDPEVVVFHHQRGPFNFFLQWMNEGLAMMRFREFSFADRFLRFLPSLLLSGETILLIALPPGRFLVITAELAMYILFLGDSLRRRIPLRNAPAVAFVMWLFPKAFGLGGLLSLLGLSGFRIPSRHDPEPSFPPVTP